MSARGSNMGKRSRLYSFLKLVLPPILKRLYHIEVEGVENFPAEGGVIVVANHVSFLDSFFIPYALPRRVVYLAKSEYFESWKTAWFVKSLGMIPVKRNVREKAEAALITAAGVLEDGGILALYPEGTRSPDGKLYRGRTGVARLALRSKAPVVPVGLIGSREVMPKNAKLPKLWGHVTVRIGQPMSVDKYKDCPQGDRVAIRSMTDEIMAEILALSGQNYVDKYASIKANGAGSAKPPSDELRPPPRQMLG
jgi:1-acyl-sn-glycerol-3-phosphate acyltransferase